MKKSLLLTLRLMVLCPGFESLPCLSEGSALSLAVVKLIVCLRGVHHAMVMLYIYS